MSSTINDASDMPKWLTTNYVENILKGYLKDNSLKVSKIDVKPATAKGESFSSVMNRVKADYTKSASKNQIHTISFLVKSSFESDPYLASVLQQYDVFNTEMQMYETVMPQMTQLLQDHGDSDQLCAKTLHVDYEQNVIIFEDLSVEGYVMTNRLLGMDEKHIKLSLRKLAKFHAAAAVLNENPKNSLQKYDHGIFNQHVNIYDGFFENVIKVAANFAGDCPELGQYYKEKLLQLVPKCADYGLKCYEVNTKDFMTLNHGDMWTNNVMLKYKDSNKANPEDIMLIDFQYSNWSSPAVDLHYFFNTSLQNNLLFHHQDKLIQYYHGILEGTLKLLNYKGHIPTLHELQIQLFERGFYAVTSLLVNLPLMINENTEDACFESIVGNDEKAQRFHKVLYTNKRVQEVVQFMLPIFDAKGLLDIRK